MTVKKRLITISGWSATAESLAPVADALPYFEEKECLSVTRLLQMNSSTEGLSPYASALAEILDKSSALTTVTAWSMAATVVLETLAASNITNVARLVLVNGTAAFCASEGYSCAVPAVAVRTMTAAMAVRPRQTLEAFYQRCRYPRKISSQDLRKRVENALACGKDALTHGLHYLRKTDLRHAVGNIDVPALIINGRKDRIIPCDAGEYLADLMPEAEFAAVADAGHDLPLCNPFEITRRL